MKSIIQNRKACYICSRQYGLHDHHIYFGIGRRSISEKNGFKVWLCQEHHTGSTGVHGKHGHDIDLFLKQECYYLEKIQQFIYQVLELEY